MLRNSIIFIMFVAFIFNAPSWSQETPDSKIALSKKTFGLNSGTSFFQNISMNLTNFKQEILTTSDKLIPLSFKANFNYYFTPKLAVRFSSGYSFSRQKKHNETDLGKIDSLDVKFIDNSSFSVTGFPAEIALIFQTPLDVRANMFFHFGVGLGYYVYNYTAEGTSEALTSATNTQKWKEYYRNPEMTLSGTAQFFILGFDLSISPKLGATLEFSKIGLSFMKVTYDIVKQEIDRGKIINERDYGYQQQDYPVKNGFDDMAVMVGLYWSL